jgi:hypothetical protein
LLTDIVGIDIVHTATQVLASGFAARHHDSAAYPGWQAVQVLRWGQMLAAAKVPVVS